MLYLTKKQTEELIEHSKKELPNEVCGILAGREGRVERIYRMVNIKAGPETFFMDSKEQIKIMKEIRNSGLEMSGIYHSHPETQAYPSEHDLKLAFYPDVSYVIVSLKDKDCPCIRSFRIVEEEITEEEVRIEKRLEND